MTTDRTTTLTERPALSAELEIACDGEQWGGPTRDAEHCTCAPKYLVTHITLPDIRRYVCGRHALAYQKFGKRIQKGGKGLWVVTPISN